MNVFFIWNDLENEYIFCKVDKQHILAENWFVVEWSI